MHSRCALRVGVLVRRYDVGCGLWAPASSQKASHMRSLLNMFTRAIVGVVCGVLRSLSLSILCVGPGPAMVVHECGSLLGCCRVVSRARSNVIL